MEWDGVVYQRFKGLIVDVLTENNENRWSQLTHNSRTLLHSLLHYEGTGTREILGNQRTADVEFALKTKHENVNHENCAFL